MQQDLVSGLRLVSICYFFVSCLYVYTSNCLNFLLNIRLHFNLIDASKITINFNGHLYLWPIYSSIHLFVHSSLWIQSQSHSTLASYRTIIHIIIHTHSQLRVIQHSHSAPCLFGQKEKIGTLGQSQTVTWAPGTARLRCTSMHCHSFLLALKSFYLSYLYLLMVHYFQSQNKNIIWWGLLNFPSQLPRSLSNESVCKWSKQIFVSLIPHVSVINKVRITAAILWIFVIIKTLNPYKEIKLKITNILNIFSRAPANITSYSNL